MHDMCGRIAVMLVQKAGQRIVVDARTGQILDDRLAQKATQMEIVYFQSKNVYTKKPIK